MAYDITGKVKVIQEAQTFSSGFLKQEMVVTVEDGKYPQDINIEFLADKTELIQDLSIGQEVTVTFDIRGREYSGRYFNNLVGWKVDAKAGTDSPKATNDAQTDNAGGSDASNDLPTDDADGDVIPF